MPKFSVIVPVYNAAATIERCVKSLIDCSDDIQIILIEDCSKDDSRNVCCLLEQRYDSVLLLCNEQNRGVSYTRNRGLDAAEGEFILFVDSDDWVDGDYISVFGQAVSEESRFAVCGYVNHDEKQNGRTDVYAWTDFENTKTVDLKQELEKLYNACLLQQLWNKIFVTDIIRKNGIRFDETISIGEDTRFVLDYIQKGNITEITLINRPLYHYMRDQAGSLMFRIGYESIDEPLKNLQKLYEIEGIDPLIAKQRLAEDRQKQLELYAYLIMHNMGMRRYEKRRLILNLDNTLGKHLYRKNSIILFKETICRRLNSIKSKL